MIRSNRAKAADAAGVHVSTIYTWLADDSDFQSELQARQTEIFDQSIVQLYRLTEKAVATLNRNLKCGHPGTETRAALGIISHAVRVRNENILGRLERIEHALEEDYYDFSEFEKTC